jgi:hypothetical protein
LASGDAIKELMLDEPHDWPKIVTRSGSPPNAAMLVFTQMSAAIWSSKP